MLISGQVTEANVDDVRLVDPEHPVEPERLPVEEAFGEELVALEEDTDDPV